MSLFLSKKTTSSFSSLIFVELSLEFDLSPILKSFNIGENHLILIKKKVEIKPNKMTINK